MAGDLNRMWSRYSNERGNLTPRQISDAIDLTARAKVEDVWAGLDRSIVEVFLSNNLRLKKDKLSKFLRKLEDLTDEFELVDLVKMTPECVRNDGGIDLNEFRKVLDEVRSGRSASDD